MTNLKENYLFSENGVKILSLFKENKIETGNSLNNMLLSDDKVYKKCILFNEHPYFKKYWVSDTKFPIEIIIDLKNSKERPNFFNFFGFSCLESPDEITQNINIQVSTNNKLYKTRDKIIAKKALFLKLKDFPLIKIKGNRNPDF